MTNSTCVMEGSRGTSCTKIGMQDNWQKILQGCQGLDNPEKPIRQGTGSGSASHWSSAGAHGPSASFRHWRLVQQGCRFPSPGCDARDSRFRKQYPIRSIWARIADTLVSANAQLTRPGLAFDATTLFFSAAVSPLYRP